MKFRPHRGSLDAAMAEMVEVNGKEGLIEHLRSTMPVAFDFSAENVRLEPYGGDDPRIGWKDVHIVMLACAGLNTDVPVGFTEGCK